jgi:hypothetical protein
MYIFSCYCILLRLFNHCTISFHYNPLTHLILYDISHVVFTNIVSFATTAAHPRLGNLGLAVLNDGGAEHLARSRKGGLNRTATHGHINPNLDYKELQISLQAFITSDNIDKTSTEIVNAYINSDASETLKAQVRHLQTTISEQTNETDRRRKVHARLHTSVMQLQESYIALLSMIKNS